jgi:uncharacterized membrane protein YphA (DoxX/SURF4 family)
MHKRLPSQKLPDLLLRIGLAFVFVYGAISALQQPGEWIGFVPHLATKFVAAKTFLDIFSVFQLILAAVLLSGRYVKYAAAVAALSLAGLLLFNLNSLVVTFRDVGLVFMAAALFFLEK